MLWIYLLYVIIVLIIFTLCDEYSDYITIEFWSLFYSFCVMNFISIFNFVWCLSWLHSLWLVPILAIQWNIFCLNKFSNMKLFLKISLKLVRKKSERQSCRRKQANANITTSAKFRLRPVAQRKWSSKYGPAWTKWQSYQFRLSSNPLLLQGYAQNCHQEG